MAGTLEQAARLGTKLLNLARMMQLPVGAVVQAAAAVPPTKTVDELEAPELERRLDVVLHKNFDVRKNSR